MVRLPLELLSVWSKSLSNKAIRDSRTSLSLFTSLFCLLHFFGTVIQGRIPAKCCTYSDAFKNKDVLLNWTLKAELHCRDQQKRWLQPFDVQGLQKWGEPGAEENQSHCVTGEQALCGLQMWCCGSTNSQTWRCQEKGKGQEEQVSAASQIFQAYSICDLSRELIASWRFQGKNNV